MSKQLPAHVSLIADEDVWMESDAIDQLTEVARRPRCMRAVGMPDLHPGRGIPIGAAFLFDGQVLPELVGGDVGCGVLAVVSKKDGPRGDALERRVRAAWEEPLLPGVDRHALFTAAWFGGPRAIAEVPEVPEVLAELAARLPEEAGESGPLPAGDSPGAQLGTIGGGNHFAEVARVAEVADVARARGLGFGADAQAVLVHSGSRGLGMELASRYAGQTLEGGAADRYAADLLGAVRYARTNRLLIAWRLLHAAGLASASRISTAFDIVHNTVERRADGSVLHRKGAAPADRDQVTLVLGSRGAPSWVMVGLGNEACLSCVAHGAGRRMSRADAVAKLKPRYKRASLARTSVGSRVLSDDTTLMYEEHPDAYKPIEPLIRSLEHHAAGVRVASLLPLITVKK